MPCSGEEVNLKLPLLSPSSLSFPFLPFPLLLLPSPQLPASRCSHLSSLELALVFPQHLAEHVCGRLCAVPQDSGGAGSFLFLLHSPSPLVPLQGV